MKRKVIHSTGSERFDIMKKEMTSQYGDTWEISEAIMHDPAVIGISQSFKKAISDNYNEPHIHIFEDDIKFTHPDSGKIFDEKFNSLPDDWDLFLGGSYQFRALEQFDGIKKITDFRSLHCVIFNKKCYDKILSHDSFGGQQIDHYISSLNLNIYLCDPQIAIQYTGYSYNRKSCVDYSFLLSDKNILK